MLGATVGLIAKEVVRDAVASAAPSKVSFFNAFLSSSRFHQMVSLAVEGLHLSHSTMPLRSKSSGRADAVFEK